MKLLSRCALIGALLFTCLAEAAVVGVRMGTYFFNPTNIVIRPGDRVIWTNISSTAHDTTATNGLWASGNVTSNNTFGFTFNNVGHYFYRCQQHIIFGPQQTGNVSVVDISLGSLLKTPTNAQFDVRGGRVGLKAIVEAGGTLNSWTPIATNTFPTSGTTRFTNSSPPVTNRFYRARVIP
jgi:plastocyanin